MKFWYIYLDCKYFGIISILIINTAWFFKIGTISSKIFFQRNHRTSPSELQINSVEKWRTRSVILWLPGPYIEKFVLPFHKLILTSFFRFIRIKRVFPCVRINKWDRHFSLSQCTEKKNSFSHVPITLSVFVYSYNKSPEFSYWTSKY